MSSNSFAAQGYKTRFNPFTGKQDYIIDVSDIEAGSVTATGTVTASVVSLEGGTFDTYLTAGTPTSSEYYSLPSTDGTSGQVLHTNGSGALSWDTDDGAGGGAPTDATYITQTPNGSLTAEQALNALSDGILKHSAGVVAQAVANTDYEPALTDSASLATTLTDETGTGAAVFAGSPALTGTATAVNISASGTVSGVTVQNSGNNVLHAATSWGGDLSGIGSSPSVTDDSHAHTTTTISGVDISADTNLSGDTENVLTGDALSIGAGITRDTEWDTSSEIATAVTDETGSGALVFAGSPALTGTPTINTKGFTYDNVTDNDFEFSDDINIEDITPHLRLTDTTASEDDFEWYAETNELFMTNVTDGVVLLRVGSDNTLSTREVKTKCAVIENLAAADDNFEIFFPYRAITVNNVGVHCRGTCTTAATVALEDRAGNLLTHNAPTVSTGTANTGWTAVTAANILNSGEGLAFDVTNAVSPETDEYTICFTYYENVN